MVPPKQRRSQETADHILDTVEELLVDNVFAEVTLQDVCNAAGVSPSSLYGRFPSKEALRHALVERLQHRMLGFSDDYIELMASGNTDFAYVTRRIVEFGIAWVRRFDYLGPALNLSESEGGASFDCEEILVRDLVALVPISLHTNEPEILRRVEFAVRAAAAMIHHAVGNHSPFMQRMHMDDVELADWIAETVLGFVEASLPAAVLATADLSG
jgi:AcrR family transcriptional regulator